MFTDSPSKAHHHRTQSEFSTDGFEGLLESVTKVFDTTYSHVNPHNGPHSHPEGEHTYHRDNAPAAPMPGNPATPEPAAEPNQPPNQPPNSIWWGPTNA